MKKISLLAILSFYMVSAMAIQDPSHQTLTNYIHEQFKSNDLTYSITSTVPGSGDVTHFYGVQTYKGYPIYGAEFNASIKNGEVVNFNQRFLLDMEHRVVTEDFRLTPHQAVQRLALDYAVSAHSIREINYQEFHLNDPNLSDETIRIFRKWYVDGKNAFPIYEISWYEKDHQHWYNIRLNAGTGIEVDRNDWVVHCDLHPGVTSAHIHRHNPERSEVAEQHAADKAQGNSSYRVFAWPLESPNHGNRSVVTDPEDLTASPYGWHDTNAVAGAEFTITRGNNVYASEDRDANNVPGSSPDGGSSLTFDDTFNINQSAALFTDASITNLFYWNNLMHDVWYHYGFDEASGNFQENNYGNGGNGSDYVNADAQDGSGLNNANFATPTDGMNPRMQMYIWSSSSATDYFRVNSPSSMAGKYGAKRANFGADLTTVPVTGDLVLVDDGVNTGKDGCETIVNASEVNGKIAYIQRGTCAFVTKVKNAQDAGAIGVVIFNDRTNTVSVMGGTDASITIPSVLIEKTDGDNLEAQLGSSQVNVSLYDSSFLQPGTYDSDFDNGVIAHEYGHGISIRLTGGPMNSSCLVGQEQMGEGWSDFFALVMTHEPGDEGSDKRGIGTYVRNQGVNGNGIRPYPYSTNTGISPYNYDHIKTFSVPHGVGSVWCSMLWDLYWAMIDEYGYDDDIYAGTGGNNMTMQLVMDALKLQPCNPGFEDGRDAILLADQINNDGANERLIWEVFANRGLGYYASQGSSMDRSDGTSDYNMPPYLIDELKMSKKGVMEWENDTPMLYTISAINSTDKIIRNIQLLDTIDSRAELDVNSVSCDHQFYAASNTLEFSLDSMLPGDTFSCTYKVTPKFRTSTEVYLEDDLESSLSDWSIATDVGAYEWVSTTDFANSDVTSWYAEEPQSISDYSLERTFEIEAANTVLDFHHWYNTEAGWDGGVVEYRLNNGSWLDAGDLFEMNGYNNEFGDHQYALLSGRECFSGFSNGFILSRMSMGQFAGESVDIRWRFTSDSGTSGAGWYIDDIRLQSGNLLENRLYARYDDDKYDVRGVRSFIFGEKISTESVDDKTFNNGVFRFYPNPASQEINVVLEGYDAYHIKVYDLDGRILFERDADKPVTIAVGDWANGVYLLEVISNSGEKMIGRMIKQD